MYGFRSMSGGYLFIVSISSSSFSNFLKEEQKGEDEEEKKEKRDKKEEVKEKMRDEEDMQPGVGGGCYCQLQLGLFSNLYPCPAAPA